MLARRSPCTAPYAIALVLHLAVALTVRLGIFYHMGMHLPDCLHEAINELASAAHQDDRQAMLARLPALIPEFQPVSCFLSPLLLIPWPIPPGWPGSTPID
ncbi:MAG: hypothetical protein GY759_02095 [Chloroflexi bacterium]|nr:hypothetical protein [Chloroflexota bacterium]